MIIPANISYPIVSTFGAPAAFPGLRAFDMESGSPVQLTGQPGQTNGVWPMTAVGRASYFAMFTGAPGKRYLLLADNFTDGTYVTPDTSLPETVIDVASMPIGPIFVQGLSVVLGCEDQSDQSPVVASQASDQAVLLSFVDEDGMPIDVSGATALEVDILQADGSTVLAKTLGSGISMVSGQPSQALVQLLAADLALLPVGDNDLRVKVSMGGQNLAINLYGALTVEADVA